MLFDFAEVRCILEVLRILGMGESKYSIMFRATKVSHTTLQRVLSELSNGKFIKKHNIGHQKVDYEITEKGRKLLVLLIQIQGILR